MLVQRPADERTSRREPNETLIGAELGDRGFQEGPMRGRHVRPVRRLEHEFVSWAHWPLTFSVSRTRNPMWLNPTKPVTTSAIAFTVSILAHASLLP